MRWAYNFDARALHELKKLDRQAQRDIIATYREERDLDNKRHSTQLAELNLRLTGVVIAHQDCERRLHIAEARISELGG